MVGPASTTASSAASASSAAAEAGGKRKFKSSLGLGLWGVCLLGTVLVLLAQPQGASAGTHRHQRRKLVKTTPDAGRNQVLATQRAFFVG